MRGDDCGRAIGSGTLVTDDAMAWARADAQDDGCEWMRQHQQATPPPLAVKLVYYILSAVSHTHHNRLTPGAASGASVREGALAKGRGHITPTHRR